MSLDSLFRYLGPNKNPLFGFANVHAALCFYWGDKRLGQHEAFLGYFLTVFAVLLAIAAFACYILLALKAPNSLQATEFDRSSEEEVDQHYKRQKKSRAGR